jgi:hypothetical protein
MNGYQPTLCPRDPDPWMSQCSDQYSPNLDATAHLSHTMTKVPPLLQLIDLHYFLLWSYSYFPTYRHPKWRQEFLQSSKAHDLHVVWQACRDRMEHMVCLSEEMRESASSTASLYFVSGCV